MLDIAGEHGSVEVVVDMTASGAQLLLTIAAERGVPVAYVTGLQMRRAAELYVGTAKTDPRDAWVLADFARRNADRLTWFEVTPPTRFAKALVRTLSTARLGLRCVGPQAVAGL